MRRAVLVVDDDPAAVSEMAETVAIAGWPVESAGNVAEALEILDRRSDIGVVVTDLFMTGPSGFDLIKRSRSRGQSGPAFVVVTAHPSYELAVTALRSDVVDFIEKPLSPRAIAAALEKAVAAGFLAPRSDSATPQRSGLRKQVSQLIRLREHVRRTLGEDLTSDPCLDILLHAADAENHGKVLSVSSACSASGVPATTALRRIADLEASGLIERHLVPTDRRLSLLKLSEQGRARVEEIAARYGERPGDAVNWPPLLPQSKSNTVALSHDT